MKTMISQYQVRSFHNGRNETTTYLHLLDTDIHSLFSGDYPKYPKSFYKVRAATQMEKQ